MDNVFMLHKKFSNGYWRLLLAFCLFFSYQVTADSASFRWQKLTSTNPPSAPSTRVGASAAFDPNSGQVILFGGRGAKGELLNDAWAFDASHHRWIELQTASIKPSARYGASMTFDPSSGQLIVFGGLTSQASINDTWAFDTKTKTWTQLIDPSSFPNELPLARFEASMAFDPCGGQLILFGGREGDNYLGDTWAFDSQAKTWRLLKAANGDTPPARAGASMDFDASTGLLVLFGGRTNHEDFGDTWTFDTTQNQWRFLASSGPEKRAYALMHFNPCSGQLILFGGISQDYYGDTWAFDGKAETWKALEPTVPIPNARASATGAFDPCTGQFLLCGGMGANDQFFADTWAFGPFPQASLSWQELKPTGDLPIARHGAAMDFDPCTGQLILFGGIDDEANLLNDTWVFKAHTNEWEQLKLDLQNSPPPRRFASMAFDPSSGQMILFGGFGPHALNDTWAFNAKDQTWKLLDSDLQSSPPSRANAAMAFDPCSGQLILFGGTNDKENELSDTWAFDSKAQSWTPLTLTGTAPSSRFGACMAFDPGSGQLILFGGTDHNSHALNDTWAFDGRHKTWIDLQPSGTIPAPQANAAMAFNPCTGEIILFSIYFDPTNFVENTWAFNAKAKTWAKLPVFNLDSIPPNRSSASMAFDASSGQLILFGGISPTFAESFGDTWALRLNLPPQITSANHTTFTVGDDSSFLVTTTGFPIPSITAIGDLPPSFSLFDQGDGTAVLASNTAPGTGGVYSFTLTAKNQVQPDAIQNFKLTIQENPTITSAAKATFQEGVFSRFTVTTTGVPSPLILLKERLPNGLRFVDNGNGTATLFGIPTKGTRGVYTLSLTATNGLQPNAMQTFTLSIVQQADAISPPSHPKGLQQANIFATQTSYLNILTWDAPLQGPSPVAYRIYRDRALCHQIAEIAGNKCLRFEEHNCKKGQLYIYYVVSVDALGNTSQPIRVKIRPLNS